MGRSAKRACYSYSTFTYRFIFPNYEASTSDRKQVWRCRHYGRQRCGVVHVVDFPLTLHTPPDSAIAEFAQQPVVYPYGSQPLRLPGRAYFDVLVRSGGRPPAEIKMKNELLIPGRTAQQLLSPKILLLYEKNSITNSRSQIQFLHPH